MKIPLLSVKLRDTMDSTDVLSTRALSTASGWKITLDTDIGCIQGILTRGEGEGARVTRVEFHASVATHWVRENWDEPIDFASFTGRPVLPVTGVPPDPFAVAVYAEIAKQTTPKPKPTGGKRGRKGPRAGSSEAHRVQPEGAGGDDPQP